MAYLRRRQNVMDQLLKAPRGHALSVGRDAVLQFANCIRARFAFEQNQYGGFRATVNGIKMEFQHRKRIGLIGQRQMDERRIDFDAVMLLNLIPLEADQLVDMIRYWKVGQTEDSYV